MNLVIKDVARKKELIRVYTDSAKRINYKGWHQGDYVSADGKICLVEALSEAPASNDIADTAYQYLTDLVDDCGLVYFNDAPERTKEDIIILLEQAIASLKED